MVVAKTDQAHQHLQAQLKAKTARREYLGVVYGSPRTESGTIDQPIGRHPVDRKKMAVVPEEKGGRPSVTHWRVQERLGNYTLMLFQLETGRTHQIRVHSAYIGHPIVGDRVYSSGHSVGVNLPGQALHAWRLRLEHPLSGNLVEVTAPLPGSFTTLLEGSPTANSLFLRKIYWQSYWTKPLRQASKFGVGLYSCGFSTRNCTNSAIALFAVLQAVAQEQHEVMLLIETALGASLFWGG
jgi:hypothetical protein